MGFLGRVRAFFRKLLTLGGTPAGIAGGFTLGVCLSLVPIPFAGMAVALALAPALRMNVPATYLGTAVINPLTGTAFYFAELWLGMTFVGRDAPRWSTLRDLDASGWFGLFGDFLGPFVLGAATMITAAALVSYPAVFYATRGVQRRRAARKLAKAAASAKTEAEQADE